MNDLRTFEQIRDGDAELVGGKGRNLARLFAAGLPVPPGFCITTAAYRRLHGQSPASDPILIEQIGAAYRRLGGGLVAVRSSATAEDSADASFAGQLVSILGVQGESEICTAVARCWESLHSERAAAYRRDQGIGEEGLALAVVVQRLIAAEIAGVLFTRDPLDPQDRRMLVEASWGLGESVVSGRAAPDRYHIDRETGRIVEQHIAEKTVQVTTARTCPVPTDKRTQPCLDAAQLVELAEWGRHVEALLGQPCDVEWAWADGRFWLLQARPITAASIAESEQVRREEIAALAAKAEPGGTVWSRYNIPEGMSEPTPMTWAIVSHLLSGRGGYGLMCRDLGYGRASPDESVYDLVAGRVYCNLSRELRAHHGFPFFNYPFAAFKADPRKALAPQPVYDPSRAGASFWLLLPLRLPLHIVGAVRRMVRLSRLSNRFAADFRQEILPAFAAEMEQAIAEDWSHLDSAALLAHFHHWSKCILVNYARNSLKITVLATTARAGLEFALRRRLGADRTRRALGELSMGIRPDPEADLPAALRDLIEGRLDRTAFLERFGHRGHEEMELAQPRWNEDPAALERLLHPPANAAECNACVWETILAEAKLLPRHEKSLLARSASDGRPSLALRASGGNFLAGVISSLERATLEPQVRLLQTYLSLRETAKHYFMRGYALLRRALVELDRCHRLQGGIFFLTPDELPDLVAGKDMTHLISHRRRRRTMALSLELPPVIFSDDLEAIGRPQKVEGVLQLQGVPLSAGIAEAPALVLDEPHIENMPSEPYILVCPSTDPAWVPLFVQARGLVMEIGGVLSHGAIVAREYGLPAVAGLPNVQRQLRSGQRVRVDGGSGTVTVLPG